ncbi:MAG: PAS domain S-box protein [Fibrobacteria bacterium]|nr:PAS domain S-box protein [Fibrobacteria bacterium]
MQIHPNHERKLAISELLDRFSVVALSLGTLAFCASVFRIVYQGWHPGTIIDIAFYFLVLLLLIVRRFVLLSFVCGALTVILAITALSDYVLFGLAHAGFLKFAVCCILTTMSFNLRTGLYTLFSCVFAVSIVSLCSYLGMLPLFPVDEFSLNSPVNWVYHLAVSITFTIVMLITSVSIYNRLVHSLGVLVRQSEKIKEDEEQYRLLAENMRDVVFVQDMNQSLIYISPSAEKLFGYRTEEMAKFWIEGVLTPDSQEKARDAFRKFGEASALQNIEIPEMNFDFVRRNGSIFHGEMQPVYFRNNEGNLLGLQAILRDVSEQKESNERLIDSVQEKEVLLRELYHRTKNNMQVITSLLAMQASYFRDTPTEGVFKEVQSRIQAMSLVHQKLYQRRKLSNINLKEYLNELSQILLRSYASKKTEIIPDLKLDNVLVSIDAAIPCGLLLNELMTNSLKHAFTDMEKGIIGVGLEKLENEEIVLTVFDNGVGLPDFIEIKEWNSFGLKMIGILAEEQLKGTINFDTDMGTGTRCTIRFKDVLICELK